MQTKLIPLYQESESGQRAEEILRSCVHCGFCNATCPTYQALGNELDGPRGRIYLIKQMLEGAPVSAKTREHLDRCLSCRSCETTCPSGVQYHELLDIGRELMNNDLPRSRAQRLRRSLVFFVLSRQVLFRILMFFGRLTRPLLPPQIKAKVPPVARLQVNRHVNAPFSKTRAPSSSAFSSTLQEGELLFLDGCVQDAIAPRVNKATRFVFERLGYQCSSLASVSCCGAMGFHMDKQEQAREQARANIDAWLAHADTVAVRAIIVNASGCGALVKDYPELFSTTDPYREKAERVRDLCLDPVELLDLQRDQLAQELQAVSDSSDRVLGSRVGFHPPCSLQHGQKLGGRVEALFHTLGVSLYVPTDAHLCCGSAGTYSLFQPELSSQLKHNKLNYLKRLNIDRIVTANIGCQAHLASESDVPVQHWLELLAEMLTNAARL
jgi:glycolate dehydrogenase iron-sulfur subunit